MGQDDPREPRQRSRPQGADHSRDQARHDRRGSGADHRADRDDRHQGRSDDRYEGRNSRRLADSEAPRPRPKTRDLNERSSSPANGRTDSSRDGHGRASGSRGGDGRSGDGRGGEHDGSRRSGSGSGDSRRAHDQAVAPDRYESPRSRSSSRSGSRTEDRSRSDAGRSRAASNSGSRDDDRARYDEGRSRGSSSSGSRDDRSRGSSSSGSRDDRSQAPLYSGPRPDDRRGSGAGSGWDDGWDDGRDVRRASRGASADGWGRGDPGQRASRSRAGANDGWGGGWDDSANKSRGASKSRGANNSWGNGWDADDELAWPSVESPAWDTWGDSGPGNKRAAGGGKRGKQGLGAHIMGAPGRFWERHGTTPLRRGVIIVVLMALALCTFSSLLTGLVGASSVGPAAVNAYLGYNHLKDGEAKLKSLQHGSLSAATVLGAEQDFLASQVEFAAAHAALERVPSVAETSPFVGNKIQVGLRLTALASTFSEIAVYGCNAGALFVGAVANPFGGSLANGSAVTTSATPPASATKTATPTPTPALPSARGLTEDNLKTIQTDLTTISGLLVGANAQINAIQPGDLSFQPKLASEFNQFKTLLPQIQGYLNDVMTLMPVLGPMLGVGHPQYYLVELLDSTELRPSGGFIGNIGTMAVSGGIMTSLHVQDVDLLDRPFEFAGQCIPFPPQYQWFEISEGVPCWSLRDSNFETDFPTSAQYAEQNYTTEGGPYAVQGVVAITPWLIEKLIALTGPIAVPEMGAGVVVTSTNLVNLIHQFQLGKGHGSEYIPDPASLTSARKAFTGFLFKHFMTKLKTVLSGKKAQLLKVVLDAFATKDVQVYFNNPIAEGMLKKFNLASVIVAPKTGDTQLLVDANVIANKANNYITYTMNDTVTIDKSGAATHNLTLTYNWPQSKAYEANEYGSPNSRVSYQGYLRLYTPSSATMNYSSGWQFQGWSNAYGLEVYGGFVSVFYPGFTVVTLNYTVPNAATHKGGVWTYPLLLQAQPGHAPNDLWAVTMSVKAPCGKMTQASAPWQMSGATATLKESLSRNQSFTLTYAC
ncbi:MAG TPA: DUF4012 domain-containing protein [Ktedonobacterales bacterium]